MAPRKYSESKRFTPKKVIIATIGIVLSVGGLLYAFNGVSATELLKTTSRIRVIPLVLSLLTYWGGVVVARAFLVQFLLRRVGSLKLVRAYNCLGIGFLTNNILPLRMGDLARGAAMAKATNIPFSTVIGSLALERLLDMMMVAFIGFLALQVAPLPNEVRIFITWSGVILGVGLVILILIARANMERNILGQSKMGQLIWTLWLKFSDGFKSLQDFKGIAIVLALEVALWGCALASFSFKLSAFGLPSTMDHSLVLLTCLGAAVALPSAPGYVGVYHAAARIAVSRMAGVEDSVAVAFGLFSWVVDIASGNLVGMVGMIFEGFTFGELKHVGDLTTEDEATPQQ